MGLMVALHRSNVRKPLASRALIASPALLLLVVLSAFVACQHQEPSDAPTLAMEEVEAQLAALGERVEWSVPAFRRRWWDYFRPTRGVLAVSERRIAFVGVVPEQPARAPVHMPPALDRMSAELDSVTVSLGRAAHGSRGIGITTPGGDATFLMVHPRWWARADSLAAHVHAIQQQRAMEAEAERMARAAAELESRRALWHRVARGQTLSSIAHQFGLTVDSLAALNPTAGRLLRVGDSLLVRPEQVD
jgi:hypothetical protein